MSTGAVVFLIPTSLQEETLNVIPPYVKEAAMQCQVFFVENLRTARRFLRKFCAELVIDEKQWHAIDRPDPDVDTAFVQCLKKGLTIGILSEAGCPGVADPGQHLVELAHRHGAQLRPLVGPSSLLLALMASGMNGQRFQFVGYLPVDGQARQKTLRELETESAKKGTTQIFIETPYRNEPLLEAILGCCKPQTRLCLATDLTSEGQQIATKTIQEWSKAKPSFQKRPTVFLLSASS